MKTSNHFYCRERFRFREILSSLCLSVLVLFFFPREDVLQSPLSNKTYSFVRREIIETGWKSSTYHQLGENKNLKLCGALYKHIGYSTTCDYLKANPQCNSGGFFNYLLFNAIQGVSSIIFCSFTMTLKALVFWVTTSMLSSVDGEHNFLGGPDSADGLLQLQPQLPHWMWSSNMAVFSEEVVKDNIRKSNDFCGVGISRMMSMPNLLPFPVPNCLHC